MTYDTLIWIHIYTYEFIPKYESYIHMNSYDIQHIDMNSYLLIRIHNYGYEFICPRFSWKSHGNLNQQSTLPVRRTVSTRSSSSDLKCTVQIIIFLGQDDHFYIVNETYEFISLGGDMNSYVERRYEFIELTFYMNSCVWVIYEFIDNNNIWIHRQSLIDKNNIWIRRQSHIPYLKSS